MTIRIRFIDAAGREQLVEGRIGESVMECAYHARVPGIIGECGGAAMCATCHAYLEPSWHRLVPEPGRHEAEMVEGCIDARPESRLTCQIELTAELDGITFRLPASQV